MENNMKRITFNVDAPLKYQIQKYALEKELTLTDVCVEWIKQGLERETEQQTLDD